MKNVVVLKIKHKDDDKSSGGSPTGDPPAFFTSAPSAVFLFLAS